VWNHYRAALNVGVLDGNANFRFAVGGDTSNTKSYLDNVRLVLPSGPVPDNILLPLATRPMQVASHPITSLQGNHLQIAGSGSGAIRVEVFALNGMRQGVWTGTENVNLDLGALVPSHRGIAYVRVSTPQGVQLLKWAHIGK
jgi:hypothetical protein